MTRPHPLSIARAMEREPGGEVQPQPLAHTLAQRGLMAVCLQAREVRAPARRGTMPKSYEDDIRDILDRMDNFLPEKGQPRQGRRRRSYGQRSAAGDTWRNFTAQFQGGSLTPHKLMGGSVLLMLFGWLLGNFSPGFGPALHDYRHRWVRHRPHLVHPLSRRHAYGLFLPAVLARPGHRDAGPLVARGYP